jgi:hypothetical protein
MAFGNTQMNGSIKGEWVLTDTPPNTRAVYSGQNAGRFDQKLA